MLTNSIHEFVYIDIPKTGSWSIEEVLTRYKSDWKHPRAFEDITYKHSRQIPDFAKDYYKIASVRNPYDRIISFYYYFIERHLIIEPYMRSLENFLDYAIEITENNPSDIKSFTIYRFFPCWKYLEPLGYDYIIKTESLEKDIKNLNFISSTETIRKTNTCEHPTWSEIYSKQLETKILRWAEKDFELFSYDL